MNIIIYLLEAVLMIILGAATFVEKSHGTSYVDSVIYGSFWFVFLWSALAVCGLIYIIRKKLIKNFSVFLLHISFIVILIGSLATFLTAKRGTIHLSSGDDMTMYMASNGKDCDYRDMPMVLHLNRFEVKHYPGTQTPSDFVSYVTVTDKSTGKSFKRQISMNHILSYKGYRFYQSAYDTSGVGTTLSVSSDVFGIATTYTGYGLLFVASLLMLIDPKGGFRRLMKNPLLKRGAFIATFLLINISCFAQGKHLSKGEAAKVGTLEILYNGRITPVQTLAYDFTRKITGENSYRGLTPEQVFTGWLFFPETWENEPMIKMNDNDYCKNLNITNPASFSSFFTADGSYRLYTYWRDSHFASDPNQSSISKVDEKVRLISMLRQGSLLKIFPYTVNGNTVWYASSDTLPSSVPQVQRLMMKNVLGLLSEAYNTGNICESDNIIGKLQKYQQKNGGTSYVPEMKIKSELLYNKVSFAIILYRFNLLMGLLSLIISLNEVLKDKHSKINNRIRFGFLCFQIVSFVLLSFSMILRYYFGGHLPMSNGYETMVFLAWCTMLTAILTHRKMIFILPFGYLLSGFCLLVASLGQMNPQVTNLMPVLNSSLVSLHVSLLMIAYALLSFTFLNALIAIVMYTLKKSDAVHQQIERLQILSKLFLYPALALLGSGIFVGAIWANISWGRYWSWDPKETWALISFLFYSAAMHQGSIPALRKPMIFHLYIMFAFATILMTYFGVNYLLGGMHSYGSN